MSGQALTWVLSLPPGLNIGPTDRHVATVLANYCDANGRTWAGRERLARETGLAVDTVTRAVKRLAGAGILQVEHAAHRVRSGQRVNVYQLLMAGDTVKLDLDPVDHAVVMADENTAENQAERGDAGSPLEGERGDAGSLLGTEQGATQDRQRGDAESPEPYRNHRPTQTLPNQEGLSSNDDQEKITTVSFDKFEARWQAVIGWGTSERRTRAKKAFLALQPADRQKAIDRIKVWKEKCAKEKRRPASAVTYLKEGFWKPFERAHSEDRDFVALDNPHWPALVERMRRDVNPAWSGSTAREMHPPGWNFQSDWSETRAAVAWAVGHKAAKREAAE